MRVSILADDPGHIDYSEAKLRKERVHVYLNDVEVGQVITADDELGMVRHYSVDKGLLILLEDGNTIKEETLHGKVRIEFVPADKP